MGYTATWRILEDIIIELRKKGVTIPPNVMTDLKSAKLMINISQAEGSTGEVTQKVEEYLANVEGYLITEAQKTFGSERVDEWLRRLEAAICEVCEVKEQEDKFILGVPRGQKWIRVEPIQSLPPERLKQLAQELNLTVNPQKDGRLVVYGKPEDIKEFLKRMAAEAIKK
ncbi:MAG: DUF2096 family protein [Candidatus Bathyarchaeia archaeon]|jgi:hypothetical protein